ncbi:MAG: prepilin peptidase [Fusobacterium sp.]|nr:prepilin peptidase [Fusobacterium sp.]
MGRILEILFCIVLVVIIYIDINKKYIPNILNFLLFILVVFLKINNLENLFIGAGVYTLPIIFLYGYGSDIMKKEIIGFGDIKLIISLGAILYTVKINLFLQVYIFYLITFLVASLFILFLFIYNFIKKSKINLREKEIAFAPFIIFSFVINYYLINLKGDLCLDELLVILKL